MGEFHENIKSVAEAVAKFKAIPPERMHGVPAIGIRAADPKDPDEYTEMDVLIGRRIDMDMLRYIPEIADNWQAQQMIASLIHEMPDVKVVGQIPDSIQKKIDWLESRDKRTDELQQITDKLEKGVVEVFQSDRYKQFLDTMAKFPRYSVNNSLLIMMQKPDAQLCQSFTGWKQMGRYVKKGEKGISILAPAPYKIEREQTKLDEKGRPVFDADGEPVKEKVEVTIRAFKVVKTFDLSQTDGKELPTIGPSELVGNIEGYPKLLQALQEISPVPVSFELIDGDAKGFYHLEDKKIVVQDGMSEVQTIKTLLHEMAHEKLHDKDNVPEAKDISRNGKEVEAKKHFTEDSLLSAMERAGADEMPDEVERKGIGTSATRAATIEKLVRIGFVERKGNKKTKYLLPTHKGVALITVMPEQIQSPSMTAEWEQKLLDVEKGAFRDAEFMNEIEGMITELVRTYKIIEDAEVLMHPVLEEIGTCPCCGRHVVERQKGYSCENRQCNFVLWKQNRFFEALGKKMTKPVAIKLLSDGKVALKGCKSKKTGKTYDTTGSIYHEDIEELRTNQKEILQEMRKVLDRLTAIM